MAVNSPRFRTYRGRVLDMDSANLLNIGSRWDANDTADQKLVSRQLQSFPTSGALQGMTLQNVGIRNKTKQTFDVFVGGRINPTNLAGTANANAVIGRWTDAGNVFTTDATPVSQSGANTGVVYAADRVFIAIVAKPSTARNNLNNTDKFFYWNGSAWSALDNYLLTHPSLLNSSDAVTTSHLFCEANVDNCIIFSPPSDWTKVTSSAKPHDNVNDDLDEFYPILHKLTAVNGAIPEITSFEIGNVRASFPGVGRGAFMAEPQSVPICSVDEAPWIVLNQAIDSGAQGVYLTVHLTCEKHNYTGTIGE